MNKCLTIFLLFTLNLLRAAHAATVYMSVSGCDNASGTAHVIRDNILAYSEAFNIALWIDTTFFGPQRRRQEPAPL